MKNIDEAKRVANRAETEILRELEAVSSKSLAHKLLAEDCLHACNTSFAYMYKKLNYLNKSLDDLE